MSTELSYDRPEEAPWINLVIAIIDRAKIDYVDHPEMRHQIEKFYKSEYFTALTNQDGTKAINYLRRLTRNA